MKLSDRRAFLLGGASAAVLNTLLRKPAKPDVSTPFGTQNPQTGVSAPTGTGVSGGGTNLPPAMVPNPPDIYVNFKSGIAQFKNGQTGPAASLVTVSRASPATQVNASGTWSTFTSGKPAMTDLGVSIWEARTNSIRNNTMAGAAVGSPGTLPTNWAFQGVPAGITTSVSAIQTINGINTVTINFSGTAGSTSGAWILFDAGGAIAATYGQTWTHSVFASMTNTTNVGPSTGPFWYYLDSGQGGLSGTGTGGIPGTSLSRQSISATATNASTAYLLPGYQIELDNGLAYNFSITLGWPQLELNPQINSTVASATKQANGASGVNGTGVYTVGGGSGTAATLNCTWAAGVLTVNSVASAGSYSTFPPSPATLTYASGTATGWVGATVNLTPTDNSAQAAASNPILTSSAAVTRNAEADTLVLTGLPAFGSAYTIWARGTSPVPVGNVIGQMLVQADNSASVGSNQVQIYRGVTAELASIYANSGGVTQYNQTGGVWAANASGKLATAITAGTQNGAFNGSAFTAGAGATLPSGVNEVRLGIDNNGQRLWNGNLEEIAIWFTQALSSATLQAITT